MTEADILALTYEDSCTVYRPFKETLISGETVFHKGLEGEAVYQDIPCALSSQSGGKLSQSKTTGAVPAEWSLFVRPEVDIVPSDMVVIGHLSKTVIGLAGLGEYHLSHSKIPLILEKETI